MERCRDLRRKATDAEQLLWDLLRNRQMAGAKFRRQHPHGAYILDFYCHELHLAIELDGSGHAEDGQAIYDAERTQHLQADGIRVMRFWNNEVFKQTEGVLEAIWEAVVQAKDALTPALSQGEFRGGQHRRSEIRMAF